MISKWINGDFTVGGKYQKKVGASQRLLHQWCEQNLARPEDLIESYVSHVFRAQERSDHWAHVRAGGKKEIMVDKGSHEEKWKTVKGFWDGSCKEDGRSGCGVVLKGVDKDKRVKISKITVPLTECTAMAAEMRGVCLFMGVLSLILNKNLNFGSINRCVDALIGKR